MKHITIEKFSVVGFNKGLIKVNAQTHTGAAFGNDDFDGRKFRASNGIILASNNRPARDASNKNVIWLRGANAAKNDKSIALPVKQLDKVVAAIVEYNFYYSQAEINKRVQAKRAAAEAAERARLARQYREAQVAAEAQRRDAELARMYRATTQSPCTEIVG